MRTFNAKSTVTRKHQGNVRSNQRNNCWGWQTGLFSAGVIVT